MDKNILKAIVIIMIIGIGVASFFASIERGKVAQEQPASGTQTMLEPPKPQLPKVLYNLSGPVLSVGQNAVVFNAEVSFANAAGEIEQKIEERTAVITPATKITRLTFVEQEGTNRRTPQETQISLGSLQVGDSIEVLSNRDISTAGEFEATQIRLLPSS